MKTSLSVVSSLVGMLLASSSLSDASMLLAGWYDFDQATTTPESADVSGFGFSGLAIKPSASLGSGGSNDGFYGNSTISASAGSDGLARATTSFGIVRPAIFELTNVSNTFASTKLFTLFFDAARSGGGGNLTVSYQIGAAPAVVLGSTGPLSNASISNYGDYSFSLLSIPNLAVGQSIRFFLTAAANSDAHIDNIAIVAIPEPAGMLALGGVLASGLLLRSRRSPRERHLLTVTAV